MANVTIMLTDEQLQLVMRACESFFRTRMGQFRDFADDVCAEGVDFSPENENHETLFNNYIVRRNTMKGTFEVIFHELAMSTCQKSQDCMDMIDIWETIRYWIWQQKPADKREDWTVDSRPPMNEGQYPLPIIKREDDVG